MDGFQSLTIDDLSNTTGVSKLNTMLQKLFNTAPGDGNSISDFQGYGSPEGVLAAGIGSTYRRIDGGTGTSFYVKSTGIGNTGWVANTTVPTLPLSVANGGTGGDFSSTVQGVIPYFSATGIISGLAPGTSGQFLKTQGAGANPIWATVSSQSNILFQYSGNVDSQGTDSGEVANSSLIPNGVTGTYRFFQVKGQLGGDYYTIWTNKFIKIFGISTVTVWCRIWVRTATTRTASFKLDIGGISNTVNGSLNATVPEWKSFTIDVSGLTNGTTYDVTAGLQEITNTVDAYCSNIIGFGS